MLWKAETETTFQNLARYHGVDYQPCPVNIRLKEAEDSLHFAKHELKTLHTPGHTQGSIAIYVDVAGQRVLFGQDVREPYEVAWGTDLSQAVVSLQKLIDFDAHILCQGHFGVYQPASEVKGYIGGYLHQLRQRTGEKR